MFFYSVPFEVYSSGTAQSSKDYFTRVLQEAYCVDRKELFGDKRNGVPIYVLTYFRSTYTNQILGRNGNVTFSSSRLACNLPAESFIDSLNRAMFVTMRDFFQFDLLLKASHELKVIPQGFPLGAYSSTNTNEVSRSVYIVCNVILPDELLSFIQTQSYDWIPIDDVLLSCTTGFSESIKNTLVKVGEKK